MQDDTITAAFLDFGSHRIKAALADCRSDGTLLIRQQCSVASAGEIRRGIIYNLKEVAAKTDELLRQLAQLGDCTIECVYAGVAGQSLHSDRHEGELSFDRPHEITEEDLEKLCQLTADDDFDHRYTPIANDITPAYYVDGSRTANPVGVQGSSLKVSYQLLLAREELDLNISRVLEEKLERNTEYLIPATIQSDLLVTAEQKRFGCALIDFGGGCTTISVYHQGQLVGLRVFPIGGDAITADLTDLHISMEEAERLKTKSGSAYSESDDPKAEVVVQTANGMSSKSLSLREVNRYIRARTVEIVRNISGYISQLLPEYGLSGIVLTGGACRLAGLRELLTKEFNVKVDYASDVLKREGNENAFYTANPEWHAIYSMGCYVARELAAERRQTASKRTGTEKPVSAADQSSDKAADSPASATGYPEDNLPDETFTGASHTPLFDNETMRPEPQTELPMRGRRRNKKKDKDQNQGFFAKLFKGGLFPDDDLNE